MTATDVLGRNELLSIEEEKPYASYIKTILGRVGVNVWDRFTNTPAYIILSGDPKRKDSGCIVDVWTQKEDAFFRRSNERHFAKGTLIAYSRPLNIVEETKIEQYTDEQLKELINSRFAGLNKRLNEIESIPVVYRMMSLASEMEKSERIINALKARISELQMAEYIVPEIKQEKQEE